MRKHAALVAIVVSITFAAVQAAASPLAFTSGTARNSAGLARQTKLITPPPAPASDPHAPAGDHTFQVNDVKGLLLTCIAPQMDTDPDTDLFNSCTLAPGRTLDDVMHTFIQAIHIVQNEQAKERAEWNKSHEEELVPKPAQK
ncbi:MAG: hypothetical protein ABSD43_05370 [Terracidiphilus sp.]|jgi:hypothetical protein